MGFGSLLRPLDTAAAQTGPGASATAGGGLKPFEGQTALADVFRQDAQGTTNAGEKFAWNMPIGLNTAADPYLTQLAEARKNLDTVRARETNAENPEGGDATQAAKAEYRKVLDGYLEKAPELWKGWTISAPQDTVREITGPDGKKLYATGFGASGGEGFAALEGWRTGFAANAPESEIAKWSPEQQAAYREWREKGISDSRAGMEVPTWNLATGSNDKVTKGGNVSGRDRQYDQILTTYDPRKNPLKGDDGNAFDFTAPRTDHLGDLLPSIAIGTVTGLSGAPAMFGTGAAATVGAQAVIGGFSSLLTGGNFLKGAVGGAIGGAISNVAGPSITEGLKNAGLSPGAARTVTGALTGAAGQAIRGGGFSSVLTGAVSGGISAGIGGTEGKLAGTIANAALTAANQPDTPARTTTAPTTNKGGLINYHNQAIGSVLAGRAPLIT